LRATSFELTTNDAPEEGHHMLRIYVLVIASFVVAAAGVIALDQTAARADWDETAPVTKTLNHDDASLADQFFRVEWSAAAGRRGQEHISGYVYNDFGDAAANIELRITGLNSTGGEVESVVRSVGGSVPGFGRAYFDVHVPRSRSYRVAVTSFDFTEPRGAK
jgi:hypothetical protein